MEVNINRPGGDYRDFNLTAADPKACQAQCQQEGQCRAWTYVRPGLQGPTARCWLKTTVPNAQPNDCCVSGVTTATQPQPPQANACEAACVQYCRAKGRPGGNFRGGICLLGVRTDDSVCGCQ